MVSLSLKKKLSISACTVDAAGNISVDSSKGSFEVMINPASYKHEYSIQYNKKEALGQAGSELKFSSTDPEKVDFDIVIDGTGVAGDLGTPSVKTQIDKLTGIVYAYDGSQHEPPPARVLWGSLIFFGRLNTLSVDYTLFKPSGEPLRAKVSLAFSGFTSKSEESLKANRSSPDLTHIVEVVEGDTLPLLCYRIYKNSAYYTDVAKINNLINFRGLKAGMRLRFPPLR
jgi:hypothetical protein